MKPEQNGSVMQPKRRRSLARNQPVAIAPGGVHLPEQIGMNTAPTLDRFYPAAHWRCLTCGYKAHTPRKMLDHFEERQHPMLEEQEIPT